MSATSHLGEWAILWLATAIYIVIRHWWRGRAVGLLLSYVLSFAALHWLAAVLMLLPWHTTPGLALTTEGLRQSTIGMFALVAGGEVVAFFTRYRTPLSAVDARPTPPAALNRSVVTMYLILGTILYAGVSRVAGAVPSATALVSAGSTLMVVAIALKAWNGWALGRHRTLWLWVAASLAFPVVTVIVQGFLGYGFAAMLVVFVFVATFYRPRRTVLVIGLIVAYAGLSVYVTYMRDRREIRNVVWSGAAFGDRAHQLASTFAEAEWFNLWDTRHLDRVDERLNQDYLVGAAVATIQGGVVPFANGETLEDAALGLIPRALWPSKTIVAGSGDLVSRYTGIWFAPGTSVGVGHVLECYINFGTPGILGGFFVIGGLLVLVDRRAYQHLSHGNLNGFLLWYLPGLSLLNVGGSFVEALSTAAASLIVAVLMRQVTVLMTGTSEAPPDVALVGGAGERRAS